MGAAERNNEFEYEPFSDDYRGFDPRDEDGARGPLILGLALAVVVIFGAVVWNTYRQGVRADGSLPLITADAGPYKRAPSDPGGALAPDLKRRIYDQIDGSDRDATSNEIVSAATSFASEQENAALLQGGPPAELRPGFENEPADPETGLPSQIADDVLRRANLDALPDLPSSAPPAPRFKFSANGSYLVQIAALRSQADAQIAWDRVSAAQPDIFSGATQRIQRADLGAKGVFYRVRAGAFETRNDASEFCDALKAEGEVCIVVQS